MRALGDVTVVEERFVRDGRIWSSAGVSAGIDLMLAFIADYAGEETAGKVQFGAEYFPSATRYGRFDEHLKAPAYLKRRD
jgi:transcriptional regulator GlxA family with amidase domain